MATILQDFYLFRRDFQLRVRDHYLMRDDGAPGRESATLKSYLVLPKPYGPPFSPAL